MTFKRGEEVIVQIETPAKFVSHTKDGIKVALGKVSYTVKPEKVRSIIPSGEKQATNFRTIDNAKYIKHLESELMAQKQTVEFYRKQNKSLKIDNQMLKDKNSELESGGK